MSEMVTLQREKLEIILRTVIAEKVPAIMSYLSKGKWHVAKIILTKLDGKHLTVESIRAQKKQRPINIQVDQPVGISFKHEYGKFVFDTTVLSLEMPQEQEENRSWGGSIVLVAPDKIEVVQRRSYFRVEVPQSLKVKVLLWHRSAKHETKDQIQERAEQVHKCCQGRLLDISAGGAQVVVPNESLINYPTPDTQQIKSDDISNSDEHSNSVVGSPNFKKGQFLWVRFTPMPYEIPLTFSAQIRNILPTADGQGISLGLQIVGLEASPEGHQILTRLISVVGRYHQINQSGVKHLDKSSFTSTL
jgi:hypothetical protein